MICAHCGRKISSLPNSWFALLPHRGERKEAMPKFHSKKPDCRAEGLRRAAAKGMLT